ncbi:MAG: hypothetical protein FJ318_10175, partial [SAR202 cluster bacterium]|nr:hypothetical protein [SAR202 cluster bacterium]
MPTSEEEASTTTASDKSKAKPANGNRRPDLSPEEIAKQQSEQRELSAKRRLGLAFGPTYEQAALGLPNYWYPVMFSVTLGKRPRPFTLLGQHIVF